MSRRLAFILAAVGLVVVLILAWFLALNPVRQEIATVNADIEVQRTRLNAGLARLAQAKITETESKDNQARLLELAKMVPYTGEIPSLILQIQDLADQAGIGFMSVTPGQPVAYKGYRVIPLSLEFEGTYFDMSDFSWRAEQLVAGPGRLLAVKEIDLQLGQGTPSAETGGLSPGLKVNMVMYAFQTGTNLTATATAAPDSGGQAVAAPATGSGRSGS